jgi:rhodanese-related sulfurtransferase
MKKLIALFSVLALAQSLAFAADEFAHISLAELKQAIAAKKAVLLDVNGTESWQEGHIPGALDFDAVEKDLAAKLPADKNALVVAYCGSEKCTAYKAGAEAAKKLGYTNVKHFAGGIAGWKKAGQPTEKGN